MNFYSILSKRSSKQIKRLKKFFPYLKALIKGYFFLVIFYFIFFGIFFNWTIRLLDSWNGTGFGVSFAASFLEDLFVFGIIGILAGAISSIISTKTPEEYLFDERIKALMNNENVKNNRLLFDFLKRSITGFLGFNREIELKLIVTDFDEKNSAYQIFAELNVVIINMCEDVPYQIDDPRAYVYPGVEVNNSWGYISHLSIYDPNTHKIKKTIIDGLIKVLSDNKPFIETLETNIESNSEMAWKMCYSIWNSTGNTSSKDDWYTMYINRYSQNVKVSILNRLPSKKSISIHSKHFKCQENETVDIEQNPKIILTDQEISLPLSEVYPKDRLEFYFDLPN